MITTTMSEFLGPLETAAAARGLTVDDVLAALGDDLAATAERVLAERDAAQRLQRIGDLTAARADLDAAWRREVVEAAHAGVAHTAIAEAGGITRQWVKRLSASHS